MSFSLSVWHTVSQMVRFTWKVDERKIEVGFRRVTCRVLFLSSTTCSSPGLSGSARRSFGSVCSVRRVINYFSCHYEGNLTEWRSVLFLCSSTCGQNTKENTHGEHTHSHTHLQHFFINQDLSPWSHMNRVIKSCLVYMQFERQQKHESHTYTTG